MFHSFKHADCYEIILTEQQYSDLMVDYYESCVHYPLKDYVDVLYKGEWQPFRRAIVFHEEKYFNWFIIKYANT